MIISKGYEVPEGYAFPTRSAAAKRPVSQADENGAVERHDHTLQ
jgi:hypothetical protein